MSANRFSVEGARVDSQDEFLRHEADGTWRNLLYYPETFASEGRNLLGFSGKKFDDVSFKDTDFYRIRFVRCKFHRCLFSGASFTECECIDCEFVESNMLKLSVSKSLIDPRDFDRNFDLVNDTNIAIGLYHALYKNASEEHQPDHAVESLYRMKRALSTATEN